MSLGTISNDFFSTNSANSSGMMYSGNSGSTTFIGLSSSPTFHSFAPMNGTTSPVAISIDGTNDLLEDDDCGESTRTFLTLENVNESASCSKNDGSNEWDRTLCNGDAQVLRISILQILRESLTYICIPVKDGKISATEIVSSK
nr:unnamed protein product [Callosobruchus analis]